MSWPEALGLTRKDWRIDGYVIRESDPNWMRLWDDLDWSRAYVDMGPSPAGNIGPYWHVPRKNGDTVHRLYPKIPPKWKPLIARAVEELRPRTVAPHPVERAGRSD